MVAELVHRVDGRLFPQYLREEICAPLGIEDIYVSTPTSELRRVAKLHTTEDVTDRGYVVALNRPESLQAIMPAVNGVATARDMARFYAALVNGGELDGGRILSRDMIKKATSIVINDEMDPILGETMRRGWGFNLGGLGGSTLRFGTNATASSFGHAGAGTSKCWADWDTGTAMVFLPNGFRSETNVQRAQVVSDAVRAAVA
jgi:CubicO group peptidase (beta-lactamase class C family)